MILLIIVGWLVCATLAAGITIADFQAYMPGGFRKDAGIAWGLGLLWGPIALAVAFFYSGFAEHGFQWRAKK